MKAPAMKRKVTIDVRGLGSSERKEGVTVQLAGGRVYRVLKIANGRATLELLQKPPAKEGPGAC